MQQPVGALGVGVAGAVEDAGRAVRAEPALARAHAEPQRAAHVVQVHAGPAAAASSIAPARHQLALADDLRLAELALPRRPGGRRATDGRPLRSRAAPRPRCGRRGPRRAGRTSCQSTISRHEPVGRELAPRDGEEAGHPSRLAWSTTASPRLMWRVSAPRPRRRARRGRGAATPVQTCSARASRKPGTSTSPASSICCTSSRPIARSSGSSARTSVVPITQMVRIGDQDVAVAGRVAAVDHRRAPAGGSSRS